MKSIKFLLAIIFAGLFAITININNVDPGTSSSYSSYAAGKITFTIIVKSFDHVKTFDMGKCYDYDIAIDTNNNITATPTDRNN